MSEASATVIGLGLMGSALARASISAGLDITVWNRSKTKAEVFAVDSISVAGTVVEAVEASDIIIVCVRDYDATNDLLRTEEVEAKLAGKVILQLSTGTPNQAREASAWAARVGAAYLDGAIMGFPDAIGTGSCTILYAGDSGAFERCTAPVEAFGGTAMLVGHDPGSAAALDNALLSIYFSFLFGSLNGAAICAAESVSLNVFRDLARSLMPVFGDVLARSVDMITADSYQSERSTLNTSSSAMAQIAAVVKDAGIDGRFIDCMRTYAAEAVAAGDGSLGNAVLFKHLRLA